MGQGIGRKTRLAVVATALLMHCIAGAVAAPQTAPITPDLTKTPGAILTRSAERICHPGYSKSVRHTSGSLKRWIYAEYGIRKHSGRYEIDHLIPLSLGGADVAANLWPQSYDTETWNAHVKDRLEWKLLRLVCRGDLPLEIAQREIAVDWIAAYQKYCSSDCPSWDESHASNGDEPVTLNRSIE